MNLLLFFVLSKKQLKKKKKDGIPFTVYDFSFVPNKENKILISTFYFLLVITVKKSCKSGISFHSKLKKNLNKRKIMKLKNSTKKKDKIPN